MYKVVAVIATLAMLVIAGIAQSSNSTTASGGEDRLFGGGRFVFDFDPGPGELIVPRDFSIYATGLDGRKSSGTMYYGDPDRATPSPANPISCLGVEGSRAVVGGLADGTPWVRFFDDQGPIGPAPQDQVTPVFGMTADAVKQFMPKHFPLVCPSAMPSAEFGAVWAPLDSGDIAVVDGQPG